MHPKNIFKNPAILTIVLLTFGFIWAKSGGITGRTLLSGTPGCTCHASQPSVNVVVQISGPDTVQPGAVATFQVKISGGPLNRAGVNIASEAGTLSPVDNSLQSSNGELTHTSPKSPSNNQVVFQFEFTAPQTEGPVTLAATGSSVNFNGNNSGDAWNHAPNFTVNVSSATALEDKPALAPAHFRLDQNFPNPFNPVTTISFYLAKADFIKLQLFDATGQLVRLLKQGQMPAGTHSIRFQANDLPSGTYFYTLFTSQGQSTRKMLLLK